MKTGATLLHYESDSIPGSGDTTMVAGQNEVFRTGTTAKDKPGNTYPFSQNLHREITPDWILFILIGVLMILAWIRLVHDKYIRHLFEASFNYQRAVQVYDDPGIVQKRIFLIFNVIFVISGGLYLYLLMQHYSWYPYKLKGIVLFLASAGFLSAWILFRIIILKLTGLYF